jgi:RNA polymerase primary sigma factor
MGTVPLLTRDGEIELAKRIARGQAAVKKALSRSPIVIREVLSLTEELSAEPEKARDILILPDLMATDEAIAEQTQELIDAITEIEKQYKKSQQCRQKLAALESCADDGDDFAADSRHRVFLRDAPRFGRTPAARSRGDPADRA